MLAGGLFDPWLSIIFVRNTGNYFSETMPGATLIFDGPGPNGVDPTRSTAMVVPKRGIWT